MTDSQPEKITGETLDISAQRKQELKQLFPGVFTETTNDKGEVVETIDFEKLKAELGNFSDVYEGRRERYGMEWPGKRDCMKLIQQPSRATLKPCREESVDFDTTQNLFIEGDNLEVLKLLQKSYYGKVKMIYIDPPYNTGKEFIYPDNYQESLETYMAYAGLVDDEGKKFSTNTATEGRFHTKWLNMMYPRLYLARNLLREDGVIFISIDDNEVENLRRMCDEIFGEENFIDSMVWKKRYGGGAKEKHLVSIHEYVLVYAREINNIETIEVPLTEESIKRYYTLKDGNFEKRGPYRTHPLEAMKSFEERENLVFSIPAPDGTEIWPKRQWRWSKDRAMDALKKGEVEFIKGKDGGWVVHSKQYLKLEDGTIRTGKAFSIIDGIYTQHGTNEIVDIFGNAQIFSFPKPSKFLEKLVEIGTSPKDDCIVLDFFAGSCSFPHAVFNYNEFDHGSRKFIAVQLPEMIEEGTEASKAGYSKISDISKERIRRAAQKIRQEREGQLDLEGKGDLDLGFKVLKLDQSNFKQWQTQSGELSVDQLNQQLELHTDHIDPYATQEEILYELLLKAGFMPTEKVETLDLEGKQVFSIAGGALLICLEDVLTAELIDAVADLEPMQFICLDKAFNGNDQLKANAVQTFKSRSQNAETEMVFKVV